VANLSTQHDGCSPWVELVGWLVENHTVTRPNVHLRVVVRMRATTVLPTAKYAT
jgi:hypothetical protein